mmetsp:Transcript_5618/g.6629  ORF Transcript_5618/g.6629 Transcript_5618/m.6629 type:complete len:114 (+) Transcript_5618:129-470(+)
MLYHFTYGSIIQEFPEVVKFGYRIAHWWEYFCSFLVFALGYLFLSAATIELIEFNKIYGKLTIKRITIGWGRSTRVYPLSDIVDVKVLKRGTRTKFQDMINYVVLVELTRNRD